MTDCASLWQHILNHHKVDSAQYIQATFVLKILRNKHIALYQGDRDVQLTSERARELQKLLEQSGTRKEQQLRTKFLNRGLREGAKEFNWKITLLPREVSLKPEMAPFTPASFTDLQLIRKLEQAFLRDLGSPLEKDCTTRLYGQVLLSAALFGGLLHKGWVEAWFRGIFDGMRVGEKFLWIEMRRQFVTETQLDTGKGVKGSHVSIGRRWLADPLTEALLYRLHAMSSKDGKLGHNMQNASAEKAPPKAWGYLRGYLCHLGFGKSPLVKSLQVLVCAVKVRYGLYIPQALVGYATGDLNAVSLPPAAWTRLMTGKSVPAVRHRKPEADDWVPPEPAKLSKDNNPGQFDMAIQETILSEIRDALYAPKGDGKERKYKTKPAHARKTINEVIQRRSAEMWPILNLIAAWLLHLLSPSGTRKSLGLRRQARQPSTAGRYLSSIGGVLLAVSDDRNLADMSSEEFSEMYEDAAEGKKSSSERHYAMVVMSRFHAYLVETDEGPPAYFSGIKCRGPIESTVDANLVTPEIFLKVLGVLGFQSGNVSRDREISMLLAILAFRCGLREGEARNLLMSDLQGNHNVELLIRLNDNFRPKSLSGTRRLPLTILLTNDELGRLLAWRALRHKEGALPDSYLFTDHARQRHHISYEVVIEPVKAALRQVTSDQTLVFHHLRHSFATWLNLKLTLPLDSRHWQDCCFMNDLEFNVEKLQALRKSLIGSPDASQQGLYTVAMLIGHSAPDITCQNYSHLLDWQLWVELVDDLNSVALSENELIEITGLSRAQIWRVRKSMNTASWTVSPHIPALRHKWGKLFTDPQVALATEPDTSPLHNNVASNSSKKDSAPSMPDWRVVQTILTICQRKSLRISQQSEIKGIPKYEIWRWLLKAEEIADIETRKTKKPNSRKPRHIGTRKRLHKKPTSNNDRNDKSINIQAVSQDRFPSPPRIKSDIELVDRIFNHIRDVDPGTLKIISAGIIFFLFNYTVAKGGIRCWRVCQAKRYLEFIELLGVPKQLVRIVCYPPEGSSVFEQERGVQVWAEDLLLSPQQFTLTPFADEGRQDRGSICINVAATAEIHLISKVAATVAARKKEEKEEKYYKTPNSYGFRYAMYMFYIMYNW
jgi:integrase